MNNKFPDNIDLKKIPLFSYFSDDELMEIKKGLKLETFKRGDAIFSSGDSADRMFIVYEGFMKISMYLSDGREQILYIYKKDDFVGGFNILYQDKYVYNAAATTNAKIIVINKYDFENIMLKNRDFVLKVLEEAYYRIRKSEELIDRLSVINADMKVAKALINLIKISGSINDGVITVDLKINREEMGSFTGLTRETISRKLSQFQDEGIITLERSKIIINDIKKLSDKTI
ncbi:MAG: Crp/Fnr family transcriptional regulator [Eubacteriales bacterium]|uniref:Crp/Fnr family transcriptional regulator n=1 Tax=Fenollaria TaxID=1686313 RepID=UPI00071D207D|nr:MULTISPECIES: Crp/Fnr family transcriptional regulator [Fenollaria]MDD7339700.1 Crp/Fnr family transcriptional regulator [Eubacteriales bacterium]MDY3106404.1 Crp/Fnr family transcriptional regulator [Fenollaria sp.]